MSSDTKVFNPDQKWACLFPGIGVRLFGKEPLFYNKYETVISPYLARASELLEEDLSAPLCNQQNHHATQLSGELFTYSFSCGTFELFQLKGINPSIIAGHSLGIYAALVAAGCITYEDGLKIITKAHQIGKASSSAREFGAVVIIGLPHEEIQDEILRSGYQSIQLANLNNSTSGVYVGFRGETGRLTGWAETAGAMKTLPLKTDIPYHNPLFMEENVAKFRDYLKRFSWNDPCFPILSALNHELVTTSTQALQMTAENIAFPIHWPGVLQELSKRGIDVAIECGIGVSLSQHSRFIEGAPYHFNLRNMRRKIDY